MLCLLRQEIRDGLGGDDGASRDDNSRAGPAFQDGRVRGQRRRPSAQEAAAALSERYGSVDPQEADVVVALGGDGLMLQTLHRFMGTGKPDLRHEQGLGRLPDERVRRGRSARAARGRAPQRRPSPPHGGVGRRRADRIRRAPSTRSRCCARPTRRRSCASPIDGKVRLSELIADGVLRRDAGRLDRLQPLGRTGRSCPSTRRCWR